MNGTKVWDTNRQFVRPLGKTGRVQYNAPNLDITPYLVERKNTIEVRVWIVRDGRLYVAVNTAFNLCTDYTETWDETYPE